MNAFLLLACPGCTFSNPIFFVLSMFAGTVPVAYLLLRPHTQSIRTWGIPRIDAARVGSLLLMLIVLIPLWYVGKQENSTPHVVTCICGLAACCVYLWLRCCWLLDTHHVTSTGKELLFPGILTPAILVLGTTIGSWVLGILLVAPVWPMILVPHTFFSAVVGVPVGLLVVAGMNYTFPRPTPVTGGSPTTIVAEPSDAPKSPISREFES
jgi:hypothetical protein